MRVASTAPLLRPAKLPLGPRTPRVERFRGSCIGQLYDMEARVFGPDSYNREFFEKLCYDNRELLFVATHAGRAVGYVMGELQSRSAEVVSLAVEPGYRGVGLGKRLLRRLLRCLQEAGATTVVLMVRDDNPVAANLYRGAGFQVLRRVPAYYTDGHAALRMKLKLF